MIYHLQIGVQVSTERFFVSRSNITALVFHHCWSSSPLLATAVAGSLTPGLLGHGRLSLLIGQMGYINFWPASGREKKKRHITLYIMLYIWQSNTWLVKPVNVNPVRY